MWDRAVGLWDRAVGLWDRAVAYNAPWSFAAAVLQRGALDAVEKRDGWCRFVSFANVNAISAQTMPV